MSDLPPGAPSRRGGEPAVNLPAVVLALALLLAGAHLIRQLFSAPYDGGMIATWGFVPGRFSLWLGQAQLGDVLASNFGPGAARLALDDLPPMIRLLAQDGANAVLSLVSYGLLHGSFGHLASNVLWLIAFGSPVARRLGPGPFLLLMLASSIAGAIAQWLWDPLELSPIVGASAAISGATAAAARFVFQPGIRFGDLGRDETVRAIPASAFGRLFSNPRALAFIGFWFATNLIFGTGVVPLAGEDQSIAWQAHIGGFIAGLLLFPLMDRGPVERA